MKRFNYGLRTALVVVSLTSSAYAQTEKGTFVTGIQASGGFSRTEQYTPLSSNTNSIFRLTPSAGYFVKKNVLIGFGVPLEFGTTQLRSSGSTNEPPQYTSSSVGLSLIARRYFTEGRLKPFIHMEGGYSWHTITSTRDLHKQAIAGPVPATIQANIGLGISYSVGSRFSLDASATLGVSDVQGAFRSGTLAPGNRFLMPRIGASWYFPSRSK